MAFDTEPKSAAEPSLEKAAAFAPRAAKAAPLLAPSASIALASWASLAKAALLPAIAASLPLSAAFWNAAKLFAYFANCAAFPVIAAKAAWWPVSFEKADELLTSAENSLESPVSFEKAELFAAIALSAAALCAFDAPSCEADCTRLWNSDGFLASLANSAGLAAIADIAARFEAKAAKPGSLASARKFGSLTITWKASVCISSGTEVSPSVTSASLTCEET